MAKDCNIELRIRTTAATVAPAACANCGRDRATSRTLCRRCGDLVMAAFVLGLLVALALAAIAWAWLE